MKQLLPTNLIAVEVPGNAYDFERTTNQSVIPYQPSLHYYVTCIKTGYPQGESIIIGFPFNILGELLNKEKEFIYKVNRNYNLSSESYDSQLSFVWSKTKQEVVTQEYFQSLLQANNVEIQEGKKLLILNKTK